MLITIMASISAVVWAIGVLALLPSLLRIYLHRSHKADEWRAVALFQAGLIVSFNLRRILMGHDTQALPGLYAISILLGIYVLVLLWRKKSG